VNPTRPPTLSIVLPAFDEAAGIERTIDTAVHARDALVAAGVVSVVEILVVDDGSVDDTGRIVARRAAADPSIRLLTNESNLGLGAAVSRGLAKSTGDIVLYTDADLPFDLTELGKALRLMEVYDADIVAGYRHHRMGEGIRRMAYSYLYNSLVRVALGLRVRDANFAAKLLRRTVIDAVVLRSQGSFIDVELLAKAERQGFRIVQFGLDYFPRTRGASTLSSPGVILQILRELRSIGPEIRAAGPRPGHP
jgi:glycosyltransferase involved in cell wall biosynthesis